MLDSVPRQSHCAHVQTIAAPPALRNPVSTVTGFIILLIGGFMVATAIALVRGLSAFFQDAEHIRRTGQPPRHAIGAKQNRMMTQRVIFQAAAILLIVMVAVIAR